MPRFHLPLTVDFSSRSDVPSSTITKATYIQNGYIKKDVTPKVYNRPGLKQFTGQPANIRIASIVERDGKLHMVGQDSTTGYTAYYGDVTDPTAALTATYNISNAISWETADIIVLPAINGTSEYFALFQDPTGTNNAYYIQPGTGVTHITDADFPTAVDRGIAALDGYIFVLGSDASSSSRTAIFNSDLDDPTTWTSLGYIECELRGGASLGIDTYKEHVVVFSSKNIQFFYNAGNATGSPLNPRKDLVYNFGLHRINNSAGATSLRKTWWKSEAGDRLAFVGTTFDGNRFIGMFEGFEFQKISNSFVDALLAYEFQTVGITGYSYGGKEFIHIVINGRIALYYDTETKFWHVFDSDISDYSSNSEFTDAASKFRGSPASPALCTSLGGDSDTTTGNGRLYYFDLLSNSHIDTESDGSTTHALNMVIQTPRYRGEQGYESRRKFQHELQLISDTQTSTDNISVQYSDDDYQNFSTARTIDMSQTLKQLQRLGYFRERVFKLTYSGTNLVRLESLEGQIHMGTN
jgi:hypothetical protein